MLMVEDLMPESHLRSVINIYQVPTANMSALRGQYEPECSTISSFHVTPLIWNAPDTPLMYIDPSDLIL
jgi:hypothetical protein